MKYNDALYHDVVISPYQYTYDDMVFVKSGWSTLRPTVACKSKYKISAFTPEKFGLEKPLDIYQPPTITETSMYKGINKYNYYHRPFNLTEFIAAYNKLGRKFTSKTPRFLTEAVFFRLLEKMLSPFEDAMWENADDRNRPTKERMKEILRTSHSGGIKKSSSPGFPWSALYPGLKNYDLFCQDADSWMNYLYEGAFYGTSNYFMSFTKDELRVSTKDPRQINGCPFHLILLAKFQFNFLSDAICDLHADTDFAIGERYDVASWTHEVRSVFPDIDDLDLDKLEFTFCDLEKQDSRYWTPMMAFFFDYFNKGFGFSSRRFVTDYLCRQIAFDKVLLDSRGGIFPFHFGNFTGHPFTLMFNTFYMRFLVTLSSHLMRHISRAEGEHYYVPRVKVKGDDTIIQKLTTKERTVLIEVCKLLGHNIVIEDGLLGAGQFIGFRTIRKVVNHRSYYIPIYCKDDLLYYKLRYIRFAHNAEEWSCLLNSYKILYAYAVEDYEKTDFKPIVALNALEKICRKIWEDFSCLTWLEAEHLKWPSRERFDLMGKGCLNNYVRTNTTYSSVLQRKTGEITVSQSQPSSKD